MTDKMVHLVRIQVGPVFTIIPETVLEKNVALLNDGAHPSAKLQGWRGAGERLKTSRVGTVARTPEDTDASFASMVAVEAWKLRYSCGDQANLATWGNMKHRPKLIHPPKPRKKAAPKPKPPKKDRKRGASHLAKRVVLTSPDGVTQEFACAKDAAEWLKVHPASLSHWLTGRVAWPGAGRNRPEYSHVHGFTGYYAPPHYGIDDYEV